MGEGSFINQAGDISIHVAASHLLSAHARGLEASQGSVSADPGSCRGTGGFAWG